MGRVVGAALAVLLLAGCGGHRARRDGAILFTSAGRPAAIDADGGHARLLAVAPPGARERSPDGLTIAFTDTSDAYSSIGLVDVATGHRSRLTHPPAFANDFDPRWSPNGKQVLFERTSDVWVVDADGANAHRLVTGARNAQWSPDGKRIAFVMDAYYMVDDRLVVANADGSRLRAVSEPGAFTQFAWRPDGGALAFVSNQGDRIRLYVADAPDFEPRPLLRDVESAPAWSPSGRSLAVAAGARPAIWVVDPKGGATRLDVDGRDPTWEPRGRPATALRGTPLSRRYTPPPDGR
jgi:Tol biopolymer transport system component